MSNIAREITSLFERGCLVHLSIKRWGNRKTIRLEDVDLNEEWFNTTKKLIDPSLFDNLTSIYNRARDCLNRYTLPFPIRGIHFVSRDLLQQLDAEFSELKEEFDAEVENILARWDEAVAQAQNELGKYFRLEDYPSVDYIRSKYSFTWSFYVLSVPDAKLGLLSPERYQAEVKKFQDTLREAKEGMILALREQMRELIKRAAKTLQGERIHSSVFEKLESFLDIFDKKNIFNDDELKQYAEQAREILTDVDEAGLKTIKSDEELKEEIAKSFSEVAEALEKAPKVGAVKRKLLAAKKITKVRKKEKDSGTNTNKIVLKAGKKRIIVVRD